MESNSALVRKPCRAVRSLPHGDRFETSKKTALAVVLAGGKGERLSPLTARRCKPAVCFGGSLRVIDFTLFNCVSSEIRSVHVLTQYRSESLQSYLNGRWRAAAQANGMTLEVLASKPRGLLGSYLGTADAVYKNWRLFEELRPEHVLVLSGDHVYHADYRGLIAAHVDRGADVTLAAGEVPTVEASSFGVLRTDVDGCVEEFVEKPADAFPYSRRGRCLINLGVYVFSTSFLRDALHDDAARESSHDFGRDILPDAVARNRVFACPLGTITPGGMPYWRDVGTIDSLFLGHMDLLRSPAAFRLDDPRWPASSPFRRWLPLGYGASSGARMGTFVSSSLVSQSASVKGAEVRNSVVGPGAVLGKGAYLEECVVFPGTRIGAGARLRRVIVDEGSRVDASEEIGFGRERPELPSTALGVTVVTSAHQDTNGGVAGRCPTEGL